MADWTNLSSAFGYGEILTSAQMKQLYDNITAAIEGSSGSPVIPFPSLPNMPITGIPHAGSLEAAVTNLVSHRIYIPANRRRLHGQFFINNGALMAAGVRIMVGGTSPSSTAITVAASGEWLSIGSHDVAAYAGGWNDIAIQMTNSFTAIQTSYLWGYAFHLT